MLHWYLDGTYLEDTTTEDICEGRQVILFGSMKWSKRLTQLVRIVGKENIQVIFTFDECEWGTEFEGIPVMEPSPGRDAILISADHEWREITKQAQNLGYRAPFFFMEQDKKNLIEHYQERLIPYLPYNVIPQNRTFKYVHLMPDDKFFAPLADIIEYGLDPNEHFFLIYNMATSPAKATYGSWEKYHDWMQRYQNIYLLQNRYPLYDSNWEENRSNFDRILDNADKMIFHGGWYIYFMENYFLSKLDVIKVKGVCVPWSGLRKATADYGRDREWFLKEIIQHVRLITYSSEMAKANRTALFPALRSAIWFPSGLSYARITKLHAQKAERTYKLLVSHSAFPYAKTLDTLEHLANVDERFQIYAITSYGDAEEIERIEARGAELFGSRFISVRDFLTYNRYVELLSQMDAAVFGMEMMCGRDTLELLFYVGAKVYLKPASETGQWVAGMGYKFGDYDTAPKMATDALLDNPHQNWNHQLAGEREFDPDTKVRQWRELFEYDWGLPHDPIQ